MQILPHSCALCRAACRFVICAACRRDVERLQTPARCLQCALPAAGALCGECLKSPPCFDRTCAALTFAPPLSSLVRDFKFRGRWHMAQFLAEFLAGAADATKADATLPVPLFFAREQWRGFNQAREIARALPKSAPPRRDSWLSRIADTRPQTQMPNAAARRKNVRGAFAAAADARGKTLLVVDDVMTSGSTLNEIARTLKKAGAAAVINLVVARAAPGGAQ